MLIYSQVADFPLRFQLTDVTRQSIPDISWLHYDSFAFPFDPFSTVYRKLKEDINED